MRLSELRYGQSAKIRDIMGQDALSIRLIDLGFLPPARVIKTFSAPGGDPMAVRLRGYTLSLRREEADRMEVEL